ncbi:hypothetical protein XAP7430_250034 [Xanthomonas phaseoli pv. phaseoli]|uniref:Uncharacterized protein n=1 Tax=Xanthomonas campestris pv. phaseoli TaxID=317013 RepID=A0AB38DYU5_XANCH|nr:hypothetical protein XAP7430_250034 [Xanthomonas phaseoli pv. phaseoli]
MGADERNNLKPRRVAGLTPSVLKVEARGGANAVAVETPPGQQIGGLAPLRKVGWALFTEPTADQVARVFGPIPFKGRQGGTDGLAIQTMGSELGANMQRAVTRTGTIAHDCSSEAGVVLPSLVREPIDGGLRRIWLDSAGQQLAVQFLARMFAPYQ